MRRFKRRSIFDQNAVLGGFSHGHHDGGRGRQPQRARARHNQNGHGSQECLFRRPCKPPCGERDRRDDHDGRHEVAADPIGQPGNWGLRSLSITDQANNLLQHGGVAYSDRLKLEAARLVQGRPNDLVARMLDHRHRLAGDRRLVDGRVSFDDDAVHRDPLARANDHSVTDNDLADRHLVFPAVPNDLRRLGLQAKQLLHSLGGLSFGPLFQQPAQ